MLVFKLLANYQQRLDQKNYKTNRKDLDGVALDIQKLNGKLPRPKAGWTPGKYRFMGPYKPFDK